MIIGITGKNASGKTEVCNFFREKGFEYFSLSDVVREEAKKQGLAPTRDNLINLGIELREKYGNGATAILIKEKLKDNSIIDSVRSIGEIEELRKLEHFKLIAVDTPVELRFERSKKRNRVGDAETIEDFKAMEQREEDNKKGQQLNRCIESADYTISNEGTLEELKEKLNNLYEKLI